MNIFAKLGRALAGHRPRRPVAVATVTPPPARFSRADIRKLYQHDDRGRTETQPLEWLDTNFIRRIHADISRGIWAEAQWTWEQLEKVDSHIILAIRNRQASLSEYSLEVEKLPELSEADDILAEAQATTLRDLVSTIVNLDEAIDELSVASRRHVTILQPVATDDGLVLQSIPRWQLCQPCYQGEWQLNPRANNTNKGLPLPPNCIIRECDIYLDLPATSLALNRSTATSQWDVFLQRYGTPPFFFTMPEGGNEEDKKAFVLAAEACTSNATGAVPHGTTLLSATVPATSVDVFARRLQLANDEILMLYTGSTLTTASAPDSGTLAGGAHADTAARIAADEARDIADTLQRGLALPTLADYHPGQKVLVQFVMRRDEAPSTNQSIADIAALAAAGYAVDLEQVKNSTGYEVSIKEAAPAADPQPMAAMHRAGELKLALHRNRSRIRYHKARQQYEADMAAALDKADLEQQAYDILNQSLDMDQVLADAKVAENALKAALS